MADATIHKSSRVVGIFIAVVGRWLIEKEGSENRSKSLRTSEGHCDFYEV